MTPRITQRDIARAAGVSHMTVSLALRSHPSIPAETQQRIRDLCEKMGYAPDPLLSSLAAYRTSQRPPAYQSNLAWINTWPVPEDIHYPTFDFHEYFTSAATRARELGYNLEEIRFADIDFNERRLQKIIQAKGIMGLALAPAHEAGLELNLDFSRVAGVRFGYSFLQPQLHTVVNAQFRTALCAVQNTLKIGYKRVGIILNHDQDERTSWNFLGGYMAAQKLIPKKDQIAPFYPRSFTDDAISHWIGRQRLDAVIGLGHADAVLQSGHGVGYADLAVSRHDTRLSGMYQNGCQIGVTAIDFLTAMIHRGETGIPEAPLLMLVQSKWMPGQTLPPL